jgi:hypothetical protein
MCPAANVSAPHAVQTFVPPVITGGTAEPASSQSEDLGARGGQALPLLLPASRNLVSTSSRAAEERTLQALLEALL